MSIVLQRVKEFLQRPIPTRPYGVFVGRYEAEGGIALYVLVRAQWCERHSARFAALMAPYRFAT